MPGKYFVTPDGVTVRSERPEIFAPVPRLNKFLASVRAEW